MESLGLKGLTWKQTLGNFKIILEEKYTNTGWDSLNTHYWNCIKLVIRNQTQIYRIHTLQCLEDAIVPLKFFFNICFQRYKSKRVKTLQSSRWFADDSLRWVQFLLWKMSEIWSDESANHCLSQRQMVASSQTHRMMDPSLLMPVCRIGVLHLLWDRTMHLCTNQDWITFYKCHFLENKSWKIVSLVWAESEMKVNFSKSCLEMREENFWSQFEYMSWVPC